MDPIYSAFLITGEERAMESFISYMISLTIYYGY
jgi:hypothetical protein